MHIFCLFVVACVTVLLRILFGLDILCLFVCDECHDVMVAIHIITVFILQYYSITVCLYYVSHTSSKTTIIIINNNNNIIDDIICVIYFILSFLLITVPPE